LCPFSVGHLFNILAGIVIRKTLDGFQSGVEIGRRIIKNLRYADDIILLATSEAELQELVDRLDRISRKYSLLNTHQRRQNQGNGEQQHSV